MLILGSWDQFDTEGAVDKARQGIGDRRNLDSANQSRSAVLGGCDDPHQVEGLARIGIQLQ